MTENIVNSAPTCAAAVANAFLDIQEEDNSNYPEIDQMKMQKLVYYSHGWWLAFKGEALFDDDIEAWSWGPVVRNIYGEFRHFGRKPIVGARATELKKTGGGILNFRFRKPDQPNDEIMQFLKSLWDGHKQLSGVQLSNATHAPGEPWTIVKEQYGDLETKPRIPNSLIRDVFVQKLQAK